MKRFWDKVNDEWVWEQGGNGHDDVLESIPEQVSKPAEAESEGENLVLLLSELSNQSN